MKPGDDLESDRYLITVEEVKVAGSIAVKQDIIKGAPPLNSKSFIPSGRSLGCQPAPLSNKELCRRMIQKAVLKVRMA